MDARNNVVLYGIDRLIQESLNLTQRTTSQMHIKNHVCPSRWKYKKQGKHMKPYLQKQLELCTGKDVTRVSVFNEATIRSSLRIEWEDWNWLYSIHVNYGVKKRYVTSLLDQTSSIWCEKGLIIPNPMKPKEILTVLLPNQGAPEGILCFDKDTCRHAATHMRMLLAHSICFEELKEKYL